LPIGVAPAIPLGLAVVMEQKTSNSGESTKLLKMMNTDAQEHVLYIILAQLLL
jgi:hypothetical protein